MQNPPVYPAAYPAPGPLRKGLAITSLVLGIVGIPTGGLCFVGGIAGLVLGIMALNKAKSQPMEYAGRGVAIGGIVTNAFALTLAVPGIIAAIAIPNLLKSRQAANDAMAISSLRTIGNAEAIYMNAHGRYAGLHELGAEGLIDSLLASGQKSGFFFSVEASSINGAPAFDATARPMTAGTFGTGSQSFACNETWVLYRAPGSVVLKGAGKDRVPPGGTVIH